MQSIDILLKSFFAEQHSWKITIFKQWNTIIGKLYDKVHIEKIVDDTLILGVYDSCWLQELYLFSALLIKKINATLDKPYIKQIRFKKVGTQKKYNIVKKIATENNYTEVPLSYPEQQSLKSISDIQLQELLIQFLFRCRREQK